MPRRNRPKHHTQHRRYEDPTLVPRANRGPSHTQPFATMVLPVGKCGTKLMFREGDAPAALAQAREAQIKRASVRRTDKVVKRHYLCPRCSHHHLTSWDEYTDRNGDAS